MSDQQHASPDQRQTVPEPKPATTGRLTNKQRQFVEEYARDRNATQAAIRAGYSAKSAADVGRRLVRKGPVAAAIDAALAEQAKRVKVEADQVLQELAAVAFSDIGEIIDFTGPELRLRSPDEIPERARRALASVKVRRVFEGHGDDKTRVDIIEFKLWPKVEALEKLAKHLGLFKDRLEVTGPNGGPVPITVVEVVKASPPAPAVEPWLVGQPEEIPACEPSASTNS